VNDMHRVPSGKVSLQKKVRGQSKRALQEYILVKGTHKNGRNSKRKLGLVLAEGGVRVLKKKKSTKRRPTSQGTVVPNVICVRSIESIEKSRSWGMPRTLQVI